MIVIVQGAQVLVSDITQTCGHGSQFIKRLCRTFFGRKLCLVFTLFQHLYLGLLYVVPTSWIVSFCIGELLKKRKFWLHHGFQFIWPDFWLVFLGRVCKDQVKSLFPRCFFEKGKVLELMFLPLFSDNPGITFTSWWWWWWWWWRWWQWWLWWWRWKWGGEKC